MTSLLFLSLASADDGSIEVVVEGEAVQQPAGSAVTVIDVDETLSSTSDVGQALQGSAGATVVRLGGLGDWSGVSLRGSSFRQVQVHLDGIPLNPDGSGAINLSELPLRAFDRVEVYRGAAPPQLAAAPIGGVVNLVTADDAAPQLSLTGGSLGTVMLSATGGSPAWLVHAEAFRSDGAYRHFVDNGTVYNLADDAIRVRQNNEKAQLTTVARHRSALGAWELTLLDAFLSRDEGLPGRATVPTLEADLSSRRNLLALRGVRQGPWGQVQLQGWDLRRFEHLSDPLGEVEVGAKDRSTWTSSTGAQVHAVAAPRPWLLPALTLSYRYDRLRQRDEVFGTDAGPAVRHAWTLAGGFTALALDERAELAPVLQLQALDNRALGERPFDVGSVSPDTDPVVLAASPRVTLALRPAERLLLRAGVGRYLRPPDFTELFGDRGALQGNPDLVPETGLHADMGARLVRGPVAVDVGLFHLRSEGLIVLVQNSQRTLVPVNLDGSVARGLELGADLDLAWLDARAAWTVNRTRVLSEDPAMNGNPIPRVPGAQLNLSASLHYRERLRVGWSWNHTDRTTYDRTAFYWSAPRNLHSAFVRVQPWAPGPSVELSVLNATDTLVEVVDRNPLDPDGGRAVVSVTDFNGYPLPGRTLLLTLTWSPS